MLKGFDYSGNNATVTSSSTTTTRIEYDDEGNEIISNAEQGLHLSSDDWTVGMSTTALACSILFLFLPVRTYILKITPDLPEDEDLPYNEVALSFPSDYDKENPLTMQKGQ